MSKLLLDWDDNIYTRIKVTDTHVNVSIYELGGYTVGGEFIIGNDYPIKSEGIRRTIQDAVADLYASYGGLCLMNNANANTYNNE